MMYRSTGPCLENPITCGLIMQHPIAELPFWNGFTNPSTTRAEVEVGRSSSSAGAATTTIATVFGVSVCRDLTSSGQVSEGCGRTGYEDAVNAQLDFGQCKMETETLGQGLTGLNGKVGILRWLRRILSGQSIFRHFGHREFRKRHKLRFTPSICQ